MASSSSSRRCLREYLVMAALRDTARHPKGPGRRPDDRWGYGLIQPVAALAALE